MIEDCYLVPTFFIDCDALSIKEKTTNLTSQYESVREKAVSIFYYVRDDIRYNVYAPRPSNAEFKASHVLKTKEGYCVQKAILLVALARAAGIPARLRFAEIRNHLTSPELLAKRGSNVFPYHGLTELYIKGHWIKATPTYDIIYCKKAGIAPVDFDGEMDAMLPAYTLDGRPNVEYILDKGFFEDLPIDEIRRSSVSWKYLKA